MVKKFTLLLLVLSVSLAGCQEKKETSEVELSVPKFEKAIAAEDVYLLDVRTPNEVVQGYIEGAKVLNYMSSEFKEKYDLLPKDKKIYIYCRSGNRSKRALEFLKRNGYDSVYHLDGGIMAWINQNKKIKK